MKKLLLLGAALLLSAGANAQILTVASNTVTYQNGLYTYDYAFDINGPAGTAITDIFLSSDDLSPLNLTITKNHAATTAWSLLSNDTPYNYVNFTSLDNSGNPLDSLANGDELEVSFSDSAQNFVPGNLHFASAYDSTSNGYTATVNGLAAPTAVPEPGIVSLLTGSLLAGSGLLRRKRMGRTA